LTAALILPTSALLGAAFPLALAMIDDASRSAARQFGLVYAINSVGSVAGALAAGFILIPFLGLETTLRVVTLCLAVAAVLVLSFATLPRRARLRGALASSGAVAVMFLSTPWDRELLSSGVYLYAQFVPPDLPLEPLLKAGRLLYYREGAAATVSVKRLTGTNTLAVDGKTDASNRGDMLTQKLVAHLPLLLHERPNDVAIIGLGSGVTVGAALTHPVARVDVIELSPEVVQASQIFVEENRNALADRRVTLHVADGRSHLQLTNRQYDVIISEPSNPWIAGVAALFTREFFTSARARLAPGGLICQWANAYNISDRDLRSIVATFRSVFPDGTAWLVGGDDVVLIGSTGSVVDRLAHVDRHWARTGVSEDLARVGAVEPFTLWSLYVAGPTELEHYAANAPVLTDDRMTLEFSAPRELGSRGAGTNGAVLKALLNDEQAPDVIRRARLSARATEWRHRAEMMAQRDAFTDSYDDYSRALSMSPGDERSVSGFVRTAILTRRTADALSRLEKVAQRHPGLKPGSSAVSARLLVARSKLLAASNAHEEAIDAADAALQLGGAEHAALEQLAAIHAGRADRSKLEETVRRMQSAMPSQVATDYYAAVAAFIRDDMESALHLATEAVQRDATYAAAYDLLGAAYAKLGDAQQARQAFERSLAFDAHDSTAYANLGVLALDEGHVTVAIDYFAEALWLDADSVLAREGLRRAMRAY
jgi:tetratricopeptide (TPR) repeat protein